MKRIILLLVILVTFQMGFAQEEVAVEQRIDQSIGMMRIHPGWEVHLLHQEADSGYRIAIITNEDYAPFAFNVQLCNVKGDTLTILENTQLPQGTIVEVEGPMVLRELNVYQRATVKADRIVTPQQENPTYISLSKNAELHVQHFQVTSPESSPMIDVWDRSKLIIDTITGKGDIAAETYTDAEFQISTNHLEGKILWIQLEDTPVRHYQHKDSRIIKTKQVDGEWVTTDHRKVWNDAIHVDASFGYRMGTNPTNANSPLLNNGTLSINLGLSTYFQIGKRLGLRTGIQWNTDNKFLSHQVKYEDNALVVTDGQGDYQRNRLMSDYIGIPVSLDYYLGRQQTESFSLDLFCGYLISEQFSTSVDPTKLIGFKNWNREKVDGIFNPWKMEVGLSFNTQHLGFFHGIRVFTNLLPEYKPGVTTDKVRSVGVEIKL
jgi:hypothetical protein